MDRFAELRAFLAVVEAGGFSAAARAMGQSRSGMNRLVIALEERLGVQLLHRSTRSVSANSTGRALYAKARQLLDDLDEIEQSVVSTRSEAAGKLRISTPPSLGDLDFSALICAFMARHPRVEVDVSFETRFVDLIAEGYDVVVRIAEPDAETTLVDHRVLRLDYLLCASADYLERRGAPASVGDLAGHAALAQRQGGAVPGWSLSGPDGAARVPLVPVLTANDLDVLLTAARAGLGIAVMPEFAVRSDLVAGRLRRVLPGHSLAPRMLQVVYPPARHLSAKVRLFTDFVEGWCEAPS